MHLQPPLKIFAVVHPDAFHCRFALILHKQIKRQSPIILSDNDRKFSGMPELLRKKRPPATGAGNAPRRKPYFRPISNHIFMNFISESSSDRQYVTYLPAADRGGRLLAGRGQIGICLMKSILKTHLIRIHAIAQYTYQQNDHREIKTSHKGYFSPTPDPEDQRCNPYRHGSGQKRNHSGNNRYRKKDIRVLYQLIAFFAFPRHKSHPSHPPEFKRKTVRALQRALRTWNIMISSRCFTAAKRIFFSFYSYIAE